jgi:hypothetical protein
VTDQYVPIIVHSVTVHGINKIPLETTSEILKKKESITVLRRWPSLFRSWKLLFSL